MTLLLDFISFHSMNFLAWDGSSGIMEFYDLMTAWLLAGFIILALRRFAI